MAIAVAAKEEPATRFAKDQLRAIIERIERLEEEKKTISDDIRDVYAEAKGNGYDVKALRTIVRMRKQDASFSCCHRSRSQKCFMPSAPLTRCREPTRPNS